METAMMTEIDWSIALDFRFYHGTLMTDRGVGLWDVLQLDASSEFNQRIGRHLESIYHAGRISQHDRKQAYSRSKYQTREISDLSRRGAR
jgi:hypothetical protein